MVMCCTEHKRCRAVKDPKPEAGKDPTLEMQKTDTSVELPWGSQTNPGLDGNCRITYNICENPGKQPNTGQRWGQKEMLAETLSDGGRQLSDKADQGRHTGEDDT